MYHSDAVTATSTHILCKWSCLLFQPCTHRRTQLPFSIHCTLVYIHCNIDSQSSHSLKRKRSIIQLKTDDDDGDDDGGNVWYAGDGGDDDVGGDNYYRGITYTR